MTLNKKFNLELFLIILLNKNEPGLVFNKTEDLYYDIVTDKNSSAGEYIKIKHPVYKVILHLLQI